jgi:hypothetical protein
VRNRSSRRTCTELDGAIAWVVARSASVAVSPPVAPGALRSSCMAMQESLRTRLRLPIPQRPPPGAGLRFKLMHEFGACGASRELVRLQLAGDDRRRSSLVASSRLLGRRFRVSTEEYRETHGLDVTFRRAVAVSRRQIRALRPGEASAAHKHGIPGRDTVWTSHGAVLSTALT